MREILFRGKCFNTEEWVEGYLGIELLDELVIQQFSYDEYFESDCIDQYSVKPETVGQYTGLTDKNGKRVFEGDILSIKCADEKSRPYPVYFGTYNVGEFDNDFHIGFYTKHFGEDISLGFLADSNGSTDFEVIGNIHDKPELLK